MRSVSEPTDQWPVIKDYNYNQQIILKAKNSVAAFYNDSFVIMESKWHKMYCSNFPMPADIVDWCDTTSGVKN